MVITNYDASSSMCSTICALYQPIFEMVSD